MTDRPWFAAVIFAALVAGQGALAQTTSPAALPIGPTTTSNDDTIEGLSKERLARIVPVMREQIEKGMFPGAVTLVARNGEVVHFEATGYLDAAKTKPIQKDSIFRLAR